MARSPEVLALIGVRAGSRGLPGKNIRPVAGHPLLAWVVSAARRATTVTRVVVSTDSEEYAAVAREYGAETPFLRPAEFASDQARDIEYVRHALDWLTTNEGYRPDVVLRLLATVPTQTADDLDAAVAALLDDSEATSAVVVAQARQHPAKAMRIEEVDGRRRLVAYIDGAGGIEPDARQAYAPAFFRANVIATRPSTIAATETLTGGAAACVVIDQDRIVDIDSEGDLLTAQALLASFDPPVRAQHDPHPIS